MSKVIDELRGVYRNIGEICILDKFHKGIYPYESLKRIIDIVSKIGYENNYNFDKAQSARKEIDYHWDVFKSSFLYEFDRPLPTIWNIPSNVKKKGNFNHRDDKC